MINRRLIRIKVLQVLYAYSKKNEGISSASAEKELFHSIDKFYDLYLILLLMAEEMTQFENERIELRLNKKIRTQEDLKPNRRFSSNKMIDQIKTCQALNVYKNDRKLNLKLYGEVFKRLYNEFIESEIYQSYINVEQSNYSADKDLIIRFYSEFLSENIHFIDFLEEENIYWNDDFSFAIMMVIKTLETLKSEDSKVKIFPLFKNDDDKEFTKKLLRGTIVNKAEHIKLIEKNTQNWDTERIAQMDLLILQMAITELMEFSSIPVKVTLNEFIEISKYYSTDKSKVFINGVLDNIIKQLLNEGRIKKIGRGLIDNN